MADNSGSGDFFAGFLVGALAGAAAALLFAPRSGEETRTIIRDKSIELKDRADELSAEARKRAEEMQVQARDRAQELQSQAKDRAQELQSQAKGRAQDIQTRVKQAVEQGKQAATERKEDMLTDLEEPELPPPAV